MILSLMISAASAFTCGTNQELFDMYPLNKTSRAQRGLSESPVKRADKLEPIRFHVEYSLSDTPAIQEKIKRRLEKFAIPWFKHLLKVHPVIGNLTLDGTFYCGPVDVSDSFRNVGVPADFILFVNSDSFPDQTFAARGAPCAVEPPPFENVIAGFFQVNSYYYPLLSEEDELQLFPHEMTHILGFARPLFDYFHKAPDVLYEPEEIFDFSYERGAPVRHIVLPQVVQAAREEFACASLKGVEVEGTTSDIGSHWEKRTMFHEYMISDISIKEVVFSKITAALLNSTGWYHVDYTYTQPIVQGERYGCSYIVDPCISAEKAKFEYYCDSFQGESCDPLHLHVGICNLSNLTLPIPVYYQWFENPELGGQDTYNDYCPYVKPLDNRNCRDRELVEQQLNPGLYGDEACSDCRCVEGYFSKEAGSAGASRHATCHRVVDCNLLAHEVTLKVGDEEVVCSFAGGEVEVPGYSGKLVCPSSDILCRPPPCMHACNGVGLCFNGKCRCDPGYGSDTCGTVCSAGCVSCLEDQPDNCIECGENYVLSNSTCQCQQGFNLTDGLCTPASNCTEGLKYYNGDCVDSCPSNSTFEANGVCTACSKGCLTCEQAFDRCTACKEGEFLFNNQCFSECPLGTFASGSSCQTCNANCQACSNSASYCTMCRPPLVLSDGECTNACPKQITVRIGNICFPCSTACESCSVTPDNCSVCAAPAFFFNGQCVTECPLRYTRSANDCLQCSYPCTRCETDLSTCLECEGDLVVYRGTCIGSCPSWTVQSGKVCQDK
mmetsp:Transcript_6738/g.12014  ORF Transcript_6738/g.12014 Transcript_6738/m.12014 type:complete len:779 (-) Transcript_6738:214-2550(-)